MGVQFRISPTTIFNMKIILALFGFFLTASSLPAPFPPCFPFCNSGQTAPTKNNAIQNCKNGQCNQNNQFSDVPGTATSNCVGSQCNQNNNFGGRKKRNAQNNAIQNCKNGQCNQNNNFGGNTNQNFPGSGKDWPFGKTVFGPQVNCEGSQCQQSNFNLGGGSGSGDSGSGKDWPFGPTVFGPQLNCVGSQCNQDNRNKIEVMAGGEEVMAGGDQERKTFVCAGGVVSSTCDRSVCEVTCSDNSKYQHDCGSLGSQMSSSPGTGGSTVVTVTCGGEPISYPSCFPFCSGSDSPSSQSPGNSVHSATTLKSCIDACPVTPSYRGCVTSCLNNSSPSFTVGSPSSQNCSGSQCSQNNGFNGANTGNSPFPFPDCFPFCNQG